jgi:arsenate reductase
MFDDHSLIIFHNPRCSKSRETLKLLEARGLQPRIIEYLRRPPTADELREILQRLGIGARELMRRKEAQYKEAGLDNPELSEEALIEAIAAHPQIMERPVVIAGNKAALGRPPEKVLEIL